MLALLARDGTGKRRRFVVAGGAAVEKGQHTIGRLGGVRGRVGSWHRRGLRGRSYARDPSGLRREYTRRAFGGCTVCACALLMPRPQVVLPPDHRDIKISRWTLSYLLHEQPLPALNEAYRLSNAMQVGVRLSCRGPCRRRARARALSTRCV